MSIYNRPYMRESSSAGGSSGPQTLKWLMISLIAVFLLQSVLFHWFNLTFLERNFSLSLEGIRQGKIWQLLSYGFLHDVRQGLPLHLIFNLVALYFAGRFLQSAHGPLRLLEVFLISILVGGLLWLAVRFIAGPSYLVGASGGVLGVICMFCLVLGDQRVQFFLLPIQFPARYLLYFIAGLSTFLFLFSELPGGPGASSTAHSAHVGGLIAGYLYWKFMLQRPPLLAFLQSKGGPAMRRPKWTRRSGALKSSGAGRFRLNMTSRKEMQAEVDRILDKINSQGFGALTEEEKETLDKAKDALR